MYNKFGHTKIALVVKEQFPEGTKIHINYLAGETNDRYSGKEGEVTMVDDAGHLHGTWGGLAVIPNDDDFYIIK